MFVLDTNILVYAADASSPNHARCAQLVTRSRAGASAWYLTWAILYEFLGVVTHSKVFKRPWTANAAWGFIETILASRSLEILIPTERHAAVAAEVFAEMPFLGGNLMHDAHTAVLMREHGIRRIYTRDADFHRFKFLEPLDPLTAA
jgi:toxin-antitoxin system PIN domain toxin